jgi:tetratricopeptide (TPR) repeat protein
MHNKPRRRILPRRERPEIHALRDRMSARRTFRFMSRYTNLPVGKELPLTAQLIIDISLARSLRFGAVPGRQYHLFHDREEILTIEDIQEPDAADVGKVLAELRKSGRNTVILDEDFIRELDDQLTWIAYEHFVTNNLTNEDVESANGIHWRANAKFESGDLAGALEDYSRAIDLAPNCATYLHSRAQFYTEQKRFSEAATDLLQADKAAIASRDLLDLFYTRSDLCGAWSRLESTHETIAAADRFCRIAGYITLNTKWEADGHGKILTTHFPGARIVERIIQVRAILHRTLDGLVDQKARAGIESIDEKLAELEAMY